MVKKNILLVFTGGTIGSTTTAGTIDTSDTASFKLLQLFQQRYPGHQQIAFKTIQPLNVLSENLAPAVWTELIAAIENEQPGQYDGIIITHGTDTLSFTAAALSFYFHALGLPMLLVSSDFPLDDGRANGLDNFICAVEFIRQSPQSGVFVPYRNQGQAMQVHQGARLAASLQLSGDFFSVQNKSFMQYDGAMFSVLNPLKIRQHTNYGLTAKFAGRVLLLRPYPGLDYRAVNLDHVDAVLHDLYHSGTACVSSEWGKQHSLLEFAKRCQQQDISVYLAPALESPNAYQSTRALVEQGGKMLWNLSIEAAYVKLLLAYGNFTKEEDMVAFMEADIAGEHVECDS
ncbi:MAG: asparaginase [Methylovulum sp.]|uniref:asparaginase n=1 Tax=Methylovulum sp. TaxID=1916980 RepID=UPI002623CB4A|nr:asparaginase [Methylovulum sp.]MDD2722968.1 asparaginase [Methylovulum sp.]MDD5123281.1 asparaginase [Methylovulum sp.]